MTSIALQILEGHERGRTYSDLPMPITIGREEDNAIRLNDERASRFHAKIQEDDGRVILTDLDSTNGTRVNGHIVQMRVLQAGDQILIGRSLIAFWPESADSHEATVEDAEPVLHDSAAMTNPGIDPPAELAARSDQTLSRGSGENAGELFPDGPPPLPGGLGPAQRAEISDLISYVHQALVSVAVNSYSGEPDGDRGDHMIVPAAAWHQLVQLQKSLADYLTDASSPE